MNPEHADTGWLIVGTSFLGVTALNFLSLAVLVWAVYYRRHHSQQYAMTYLVFNAITFFLCLLLSSVPLQLGFALGLFAVFGILRYRTEAIRITDLTYLFAAIGLAVLNGVGGGNVGLGDLGVVNAFIVVVIVLCDQTSNTRRQVLPVLYDRIDLVGLHRRQDLCKDLSERLGVSVQRVEVHKVDLLRDTVELSAHCNGQGPE